MGREGIDILLVQPEQGSFVYRRIFHPGVEIPLNLLCLAGYVGREGIESRILDLRIKKGAGEEVLRGWLRELKPRVVGISACTTEVENAGEVARVVRQESGGRVPVLLGGHHASAVPEETLGTYPEVDYLICGEGEVALTEFMRLYLGGQDVRGAKSLVYREGEGVVRNVLAEQIRDLDSLPLQPRGMVELDKYVPSPGTGNYMRLPSTGIVSSRGCPYNCHYCSKGVYHRTIRFRSPENVVAEMEDCMGRYGIRDFRFYDDVLTYPKWDLERFCGLILERGLDVTWNCYSRVNHITLSKLEMMKRAGCYHIKYGIEFGTEKALILANKQATLAQAREAVRLTKQVGIECKGNFILGIPGEDLEDCRKTVAFARELSPDLVSFYPHDVFPGTHFYHLLQQPGSELKMLPREETEELAYRAYLSFYLRPSYMLQRARRVSAHPKRELQVVWSGLYMMGRFYLKSGWQFLSHRRDALTHP